MCAAAQMCDKLSAGTGEAESDILTLIEARNISNLAAKDFCGAG